MVNNNKFVCVRKIVVRYDEEEDDNDEEGVGKSGAADW